MTAGAKPGERRGGRAKGTKNKLTVERLKEIARKGETPLAYMLRIMRDKEQPDTRRDEMAKSAARYCHPAIVAVEAQHSGNIHHTHEQALRELE